MIHRVFGSDERFKRLEFRPGFNLLVAERHRTSGELQTRNRAGKSSLIEIVHFLLGANAGGESIFRKPELAETVFGLDFDLGPSRVVAERTGETFGRTIIREGARTGWAVQPATARGAENSLSQDEWRRVLGEVWFGLHSPQDAASYRPSFRSLFCYFARREPDGGMQRPEAQSKVQQPWDQQVAIGFLLDLDWAIASEWQKVRDRERALRELRHAAKEGVLGEIISSSAELRTQLVVAEQKERRVREALETFEVLPEYRQLEREASDLTHQIAELSDENTLDEEIVDTTRRAVQEEQPPALVDVDRLFEESGVILPGLVTRRFEEVGRFHESVIANRRSYLNSEITAAEARLTRRRTQMQELDQRRSAIMRLLKSKGALEQFQQLQEETARLTAQTETLRHRFQTAQQLEGAKGELDVERAALLQRLRRDLIEQEKRVDKAIVTFQEVSNALYEDAGSLTLAASNNGLKVQFQIQGDRSRGIRNMQIFCFDIMLMRLCAERMMGPGFLIHDSHLFDGVDERQVGRAFAIGAEAAARCGWQYIVTMNEDDLPRTLPKGFRLDDYKLPVRLTDERDDGGLFGFRF